MLAYSSLFFLIMVRLDHRISNAPTSFALNANHIGLISIFISLLFSLPHSRFLLTERAKCYLHLIFGKSSQNRLDYKFSWHFETNFRRYCSMLCQPVLFTNFRKSLKMQPFSFALDSFRFFLPHFKSARLILSILCTHFV